MVKGIKAYSRKYLTNILLLLLLFVTPPTFLIAQTTTRTPAKKALIAQFTQKDVELKKSEIVSNVLKIVNTSDKPISFVIDISHPLYWKSLIKSTTVYEIPPKDSLFIPVRIIPGTAFKGNMQYMINAFIISEDGNQLSSDLFFASTKKVVRWELSVLPKDRIYFLNGENTAGFSLNIFNSGNETQDILLTLDEFGRNIILSDTADKIIPKRFFDISLLPTKDTTLRYKLSYFDGKKNFSRIDNENYLPKSAQEEQKYTLFARTTESKQAAKSTFVTGKKIDFIKLSNQKKLNPYGNSVIPLIVDANIYNILGKQPMMSIIFSGHTVLSKTAHLIYFSQVNYSAYSYNPNTFKNNAWYIGYYNKRGSIQIGTVTTGGSVGMPASGQGISASYVINNRQSVGAFISKSPKLFGESQSLSFGASHQLSIATIKFSTAVGRTISNRVKSVTDYVSERIGFRITRKHQFSAGATGTRTVNNSNVFNPTTRVGYLVNGNYAGLYLVNKLSLNLQASYTARGFSTTNSERLSLVHRSLYTMSKKWTMMMQNSYYHYESPYYKNGVQTKIYNTLFNNQLFFVKTGSDKKLMPNAFYNISDVYQTELHYRGLGLDYNYFNSKKNFRFSNSVKGGYNNLITYPEIKEYFTFQLFSLCQYQNFSLNVRYNYGAQTIRMTDTVMDHRVYPQLIYISAQHQHVFRDPRFVLQTSANYSYSNVAYNHSFGLYPEIYFYSYNGWRFKVNVGYNLNVSNRNKAGLYTNTNPSIPRPENLSPDVTYGFTMGAGIRKEFGIPIPKRLTKERFYDVEFVAFLDINGNRIKDKEEVTLENIVIRLGDDEVLTDKEGQVKLLNIRQGNYLFSIVQLEDYKGWFPLLPDSIAIENDQKQYVPFVRGIKLSGNLVIDREKYAADSDIPLDLSKFRISVTDSAGKALSTLTDATGSYTLYVPSGKYILTMDESLLGERFVLAQNNIEIELKVGMEGLFNTFYVIERKRKINIKKAKQE